MVYSAKLNTPKHTNTVNAVSQELLPIQEKLELVKNSGFGEIRIQVRNGVVYRILCTEELLIKNK